MDVPDPQYVRTRDGAYIAYQVVGDGPVDVAWQSELGGSLDVWWEFSWASAWLEGLASFSRLILHDWRGTGLSSRNVPVPNLETRADDLRAVLDAVGSHSTVMAGLGESFTPCALLAASDPARVRALVWWTPRPRTVWAPDYPWGDSPEEVARDREALKGWGAAGYSERCADGAIDGDGLRPPEEVVRWMTKKTRSTCTPDVAVELCELWWQSDIRPILPTVQVPTLLLVDGDDDSDAVEHLVSLIPHAQVEVVPDKDWHMDRDALDRANRPLLEAIQRFVGIEPKRAALETILSTVLFTDIIDSTRHQARLGDRAWKVLVERHHATVRSALTSWRGVENDTAGDGFYATFNGPARAIHCANEIRDRGARPRHRGPCRRPHG